MPNKKNVELEVTVFGSADPRPGESAWETAQQLGEALANAGFGVVNGGYGGTMEAVAIGARRAGGHTTGVVVDTFNRSPNPYLDETISAASLLERLDVLLARGQGYVALPGGTGTLVELALSWELMAKGISPQKPIVLLGDFWTPVIETALRRQDARGREGTSYTWPSCVRRADSVDEAVEILKKRLLP